MANYILRDLPQGTWDRFKARSMRDGWHLRRLFIQLMDDYGNGAITPSVVATATPALGMMPATCPNGHQVEIGLHKAIVLEALQTGAPVLLYCPKCGTPIQFDDQDRAHVETWAYSPTESS